MYIYIYSHRGRKDVFGNVETYNKNTENLFLIQNGTYSSKCTTFLYVPLYVPIRSGRAVGAQGASLHGMPFMTDRDRRCSCVITCCSTRCREGGCKTTFG